MIGRTISHYRIVEKLGQGGMGVVYAAEDIVLGRTVAIKMLTAARTGDNQHFRTRFLREARAVSALSHPHIATIFDYGEDKDGEPYIVMELIKGETLGDMMLKEKLTIPRAIEIIRQVGEALSEAHRRGIIHRDIKPSNVAINERGNVKVLDFGLAKQIDSGPINPIGPEGQTLLNTQTREGVIVGTPMYLSPEQALGVEVDARSDLFSLGGLLYECVAGKPPFVGQSPIEICAKVIRDDPQPPSQLNPDVSPEMDRIAMKALAKKPENRYQTADEMIADLRGIEDQIRNLTKDRTVTRLIAPAPGTQRSGTLATLSDIFRRPRLSIGYVAAAIILLVPLIAGVWWWRRPKLHVPPDSVKKLYETGIAAIHNGSFYQASRALQLAVTDDDEFALAHARLAEAFMEIDYVDKAKDEMLRVNDLRNPERTLFTRSDDLYLDAVTAIVRRDYARAIDAYSEVARNQPDKAEVYVDLGRAYEKSNQPDKAIQYYVEATKRDPQRAAAFLRLGVQYARQHKNQESKNAFDKADEIYQLQGNVEGRAEVALQRGVALNEIESKLDEARVQLEQARDMARVLATQYQQVRILFQLGSVALKQGKGDQAAQFARDATDLAQANQMETLAARGLIDIGYTAYLRTDYGTAERNFKQALDLAKRFSAKQNEARAQLSLASLYMQLGDADQALLYEKPARAFYQSGGFRTETNQAMNLEGRAYRQKGNYDAAVQSLQDQLKFAQQTNDKPQIASAHTSIGYLLLDQEKYAEALEHFNQNLEINTSLNNQLYQGYALMNRGATYWRLGQDALARADLDHAASIAKRDDSSFKELEAYVGLINAQIAFSDRRFGDAIKLTEQSLALAGEQNKIATVRGKIIIGLSQSHNSQAQKGRETSQKAVELASTIGDPLLLARARLALAEATLLSGDAKQSLSYAQQAQTFFSAASLAEHEWRASLIQGFASRKSGDETNAKICFAHASELLSSLEQKWGKEVFNSYLKRPDTAEYKKGLDEAVRQ